MEEFLKMKCSVGVLSNDLKTKWSIINKTAKDNVSEIQMKQDLLVTLGFKKSSVKTPRDPV